MKNRSLLIFAGLFLIIVGLNSQSTVKLWEEPLTLPSYLVDTPDLNPMFYTGRGYQGAQRRVYPYPLLDNLTNEKVDKTYKALYLENEYIKLCVLPELGGKLFYATDKTNGYEIFYRQNVIKPALIGMLGAWISGGVEWCVFHHHRASTFMPVDYTLKENEDGSKTIWIGEIEPRHRMKWSIGITLHPGKSYIEANVKMFNRTPVTHSILYWANVATHCNKDYQVFFPPSMEYGTHHAKNDFVHWPISRSEYRKNKFYENEIDMSWWINNPIQVSFFAFNLKEGFFAGYDHAANAGTMHVGNPHIVNGAKLFQFGPGYIGKMWDEVLTDSDGPYIELMVGAYSDNQPDYSWIKPYEVKTFKQFWYPMREIGGVLNANKDASVNFVQKEGKKIHLAYNTTSEYKNAKVIVKSGEKILYEIVTNISPFKPFKKDLILDENEDFYNLETKLLTSDEQTLIDYKPIKREVNPELPEFAVPPANPKEIETVEELYFEGLRILEFHNSRLDPMPYFEEALRRDPLDSRTNTVVGMELFKKGRFEEAKTKFRNAIARNSWNYTRPRNTEAYYGLGITLKMTGEYDAAYDTLYRATWDYPFHSAAYYHLAEISSIQKNYTVAMEQCQKSLYTDILNTKALNLMSSIYRKLNQYNEAKSFAEKTLEVDPLDFYAHNELYLIGKALGDEKMTSERLKDLDNLLRNLKLSYLELAVDYGNAGFYEEAIDVLKRAENKNINGLSNYPMVHYYLGYYMEKIGEKNDAKKYYIQASKLSTNYNFPFRLESIKVLSRAIELNSNDAKAYYYLGNLLYDHQPHKSIEYWEKAVSLDNSLAIAYRNLGWGYFRAKKDLAKAIENYEKAIAINNNEAKYFYELDVLYEINKTDAQKRFALLEDNFTTIKKRDDSFIRIIILLNQLGKYDEAIKHLTTHFFHIREGDSQLRDINVDARLLRGISFFEEKKYNDALNDFLEAHNKPDNQQVGRRMRDARNPQINYYIGLAFEAFNESDSATKYYTKCIEADIEQSPFRYYQGLAYQKLKNRDKAQTIFNDLVATGNEITGSGGDLDFFAKFGARRSIENIMADGYFTKGLGLLGLEKNKEAKEALEEALDHNPNHIWAMNILKEVEKE